MKMETLKNVGAKVLNRKNNISENLRNIDEERSFSIFEIFLSISLYNTHVKTKVPWQYIFRNTSEKAKRWLHLNGSPWNVFL